jgi:uncharacterized protein YkwD
LDGRREHRLGERLAGDAEGIVAAWMRSPGHRANLLRSDFAEVGIGIAEGAPVAFDGGEAGSTYVTDFGRRRQG